MTSYGAAMPVDPTDAGAGSAGSRLAPDADYVEARFAADDPGALKLAYDAHGGVIFSFCRRAVGADQAADVTQEVFVTAWKVRARFDPAQGTLRSWLFGIARFKVLGVLRGRPPLHAVSSDEEEREQRAPMAADVDRLADRMVLADAMAGLGDRARQVIHLAYVEDLTHAQIAERTKLPLGTVKSDLRRALARLRTELEASDGW